MDYYNYSSAGSRSNCRQTLFNPYTGESVLICARNYESLRNKIEKQNKQWEKEHQEKLAQEQVDLLNNQAKELKHFLLNMFSNKTNFNVQTYYSSLLKEFIKEEFVTDLIKPIYEEPKLIRNAIKENKFLEFFSKKRKARRLKEEEEDRILNQKRKNDALNLFNRVSQEYEENLQKEIDLYEESQNKIKEEIDSWNDSVSRRKRNYEKGYSEETINLLKDYFSNEYYPECVKEEFSKIEIKYDDLRKNVFITRRINLDNILPEYWSFEFKGLTKGIQQNPWKFHEKRDNYNLILQGLMVKTIRDIFGIMDNSHVDDISYTCFLQEDKNEIKTDFWIVDRESFSLIEDLKEESHNHHDLKGLKQTESTLVEDKNFDVYDDELLIDLLNEINGKDNSDISTIVLENDEQILLDSLKYLSSKAYIGCKPYYKTIFSFVTGNSRTPFYNSFKVNSLFGCLPNISNTKLQILLDALVNKGFVNAIEINEKFLYYPKNN